MGNKIIKLEKKKVGCNCKYIRHMEANRHIQTIAGGQGSQHL